MEQLPEEVVTAGTIATFKIHGKERFRGIWAKCKDMGLAQEDTLVSQRVCFCAV